MRERKRFWTWFWGLFITHLHYFVIDEKKREGDNRYADEFWYYKRRFWHFYKTKTVENDGRLIETVQDVWQAHLETPFRKWKYMKDHIFNIRFHIGNLGSETPWDGHLTLFGWSWYWGHSGMRKLADRLTRCSGYKYDTRDWRLRISDGKLWYSIAEHSDMCNKYPRFKEFSPRKAARFKKKHPSGMRTRRRRIGRQGVLNLSIPEAIWGPKRYKYEDVAVHQTVLKFPEDGYAVILTLQKVFFGRTKVDKSKHIQSWTVDVDAPRGIPTHVDHSGGYKGDRTFGFGVKLPVDGAEEAYILANWEWIGLEAAKKWVLDYRERTGFVNPDPQEVE